MENQIGALADGTISYVFILVADLQRMLAFYREVLGFYVLHLEPDDCAFLALNQNRTLTLALYKGRQGSSMTPAHWFIVIDVESIDLALAKLRSAGVHAGDIKHVPYGRAVQFSDPEGNIFEVHERASDRGISVS